jgi:hypothetical protein
MSADFKERKIAVCAFNITRPQLQAAYEAMKSLTSKIDNRFLRPDWAFEVESLIGILEPYLDMRPERAPTIDYPSGTRRRVGYSIYVQMVSIIEEDLDGELIWEGFKAMAKEAFVRGVKGHMAEADDLAVCEPLEQTMPARILALGRLLSLMSKYRTEQDVRVWSCSLKMRQLPAVDLQLPVHGLPMAGVFKVKPDSSLPDSEQEDQLADFEELLENAGLELEFDQDDEETVIYAKPFGIDQGLTHMFIVEHARAEAAEVQRSDR